MTLPADLPFRPAIVVETDAPGRLRTTLSG